jgi:hypothetical protein
MACRFDSDGGHQPTRHLAGRASGSNPPSSPTSSDRFAPPPHLRGVGAADAGPTSLYHAGRALPPSKTRVSIDFIGEAFRRERCAERFAGSL